MNVTAYVDEYGNAAVDTDIPGVSSHFIIAAVLVEDSKRTDILRQFEEVQRRHFQAGEMKSSKVASNDDRRARVLADLCAIPFKFYAFVVDKRDIKRTSGLIYKKSFLKFLHGIVYRQIYRAFPSLSVIADEHGSRDFMDGFVEYVRKNHMPDLFIRAELEFSTCAKHPMLGIADFDTGTLARYYDIEKSSSRGLEFIRQLQERTILIEAWPPRSYLPSGDATGMADGSLDKIVTEQALSRAVEFIESNMETHEELIELQVEIAKYLLYVCKYEDPHAYVPTHQLINHIDEEFAKSISVHLFRTQVIAKLRDSGLLIASSPKGYKIPVSVRDMDDFAQQARCIIGPMLSRVQKARKQVLLASSGSIDILARPEYQYIRSLVDSQEAGIALESEEGAL